MIQIKKCLCLLGMFVLFHSSANAASMIFENYSADKLKQDIIKVYALNGAKINSNKLEEYSFSIDSSFTTGWDNYLHQKNITIIQLGKNCIVNLDGYISSTFYKNAKVLPYYEYKDLSVLKTKLKGGYTYGLSYFIKPILKVNEEFMNDGFDSNGIPIRVNDSITPVSNFNFTLAPKSTFRGPKLIFTSYDAKKQGLKSKYRIVEINNKHIRQYKPQQLWELLNPTNENQSIKVGYKEKCGGKVKQVTLHSKYQKPILENL